MLLNKENIFEFLRCPKTDAQLKQKDEVTLIGSNAERIEYPILNGCPILIDFERSVVKQEDIFQNSAQSVITRKSNKGLSEFLKRIIFPTSKATLQNVNEISKRLHNSSGESTILIIGGATVGQGMQSIYDSSSIKIISFDIYASQYVQFVADAHKIPLPNNCFDAVIIQAVLEHVIAPQQVVTEIHRVLKPAGIVYAETPFMQHVHEGAYDFTRFTESGHRYLFKNFALIKSGVVSGVGTQLLWSIEYFFRGIFRSKKIGKIFKLLFSWLRFFDVIIPESYSIDAASGVFFLGSKNSTSVKYHEIIEHYKGVRI